MKSFLRIISSVLTVTLAILLSVGCGGSNDGTRPLHFVTGALSVSGFHHDASIPPPKDQTQSDLRIIGSDNRWVVELFGISLQATQLEYGLFSIDPLGNEEVASALWQRAGNLNPLVSPWMSTWVSLDSSLPISLKVEYDRFGEITSAKVDFGLLVSSSAVEWAITANEVLSVENLVNIINKVPKELDADRGYFHIKASLDTKAARLGAIETMAGGCNDDECACQAVCRTDMCSGAYPEKCKDTCVAYDKKTTCIKAGIVTPQFCVPVCNIHAFPELERWGTNEGDSWENLCGYIKVAS